MGPIGSPPVYRHAKGLDGTFTIFDVPIFSVNTRGNDKELEFGVDWLHGALATAQQRQEEGYLAPLHVRHHGDAQVAEAAGKFRLTRVGSIMHGGEEVPTVFADLVGVRPAVFDRIQRGELSYRSVEILDVNEQEIDSLALLDDEVPFFRFPLLRVAEAKAPLDSGTRITTLAQGGPILAYSQTGDRVRSLAYYVTEAPMTTPNTATGKADTDAKATFAANAEQVLMQIFQLLKQVIEPQQEGMPNPQAPAEQPAPAMQQGMGQGQGMGQRMGLFSAETAPAPAETKPEQQASTATELVAQGAQDALVARMDRMERTFGEFMASQQVEAKASQLQAAGFGVDHVNTFRAAAAKGGLDAALSYAQGMERIGPSEPPTHWTGEINPHTSSMDPPEVAAFAAQGPEALSTARDLFGSWSRSESPIKFNDYVSANSNPDAFLGVKTTPALTR